MAIGNVFPVYVTVSGFQLSEQAAFGAFPVSKQCGCPNVYRLVIISDYPLNTDSEAVEQLVNHIKALKRRCDFKIVYVDVAGNQRPGSLEEVIDFYDYEEDTAV